MAHPFGHLLKDWRGRRRLSQLALGLKADVSSRHVAFLETGRARPSRTMVLQLADALDMPLASRNGFLDAAGFKAAYAQRSLDDDSMAAVRGAIDWSLQRHEPYPAFAKDRAWRLVASNTIAMHMLSAAGLRLGDCLLDLLCDGGRLIAVFANAGEVGRHVMQRLRIESAFYGGDLVLEEAANRLAALDVVKAYQPPQSLPPFIPAIYRMGEQQLSFFSTLAQFGTAEDLLLADLQIEYLFPADEATREAMEQLAKA